MRSRRRLRRRVRTASVVAGLGLFTTVMAAPIAWLVASSLMRQQALIAVPPDLSWSSLTLENYAQVLGSVAALGRGLLNSFIVAASTTALALALGAPAAYALARAIVPRSGPILALVLATQMFPAIVIAIPMFVAMSRLGLIDSRLGLIIVYLSFNLPVVIWVLRGFFVSIPASLERAAAIDGASRLQVFTLVVLPISLPALSAAGLFAFIESWNEFFFALILTRQDAQTVPLVVSQFAGQYQTQYGQMMAAAVLSVTPVVLLSILCRGTIMRGFSVGITKG